MLIKVGYDITLQVAVNTTILYCLRIHPSRVLDIIEGEKFNIEYAGPPAQDYWDAFGNCCGRLTCSAGRVRFRNHALVNDSGLVDYRPDDAVQHELWELPVEMLRYLMPSRYCEADSELLQFAWSNFGNYMSGLHRVQAIVEFVHHHLTFDYQRARRTRTALQAFQERTGVCRDFAHLAITLCRCMNIPARYVTGYLGDIGVPPVRLPMDFSAWMEVYLGGQWITFDARHNARRVGRIVMATGLDATDVAITTVFGDHSLVNFTVVTDEVG